MPNKTLEEKLESAISSEPIREAIKKFTRITAIAIAVEDKGLVSEEEISAASDRAVAFLLSLLDGMEEVSSIVESTKDG